METKCTKILFSVFLVLCVFCEVSLLSSCHKEKNDDEAQATLLFTEIRTAVERQDFDHAHLLVDSLRTAYPRAVQTRRALLAYEDSLSLEEARVESALAADSLSQAEAIVASLEAAHVNQLDPRMKEACARADTLRMSAQRKYMKVRFFERKIEEAQKKH